MPSSMLFLTTGGIVNVTSMSRTAQMEINVCSDMAQMCWVAIPRLYSNGHRRERPTTYGLSRGATAIDLKARARPLVMQTW